MVRIWQKVKENKLPVIIPIIFYNGDNEWTAPVEFKELFAQEDDWSKNVIPNFEYFLSKDEELIEKIPEITTPKFRIAVLNLRLSRSLNEKEFIDRFIDLLIELKKYLKKTGDVEYFQINIIYVFYNADPRLIEKEKVIDLTKKYFPERGDHLETLADEFKKEGREEGEKEGIIKTLTRKVFISPRSGSLSRKHYNNRLKEAVNEAGIDKNITAHSIRHSTAVSLLKKDVPLKTIQDLLGHENLETTSVYLHADLSDMREAVDVL